MTPVGYLLDSDLLFGSRITGTAQTLGLPMTQCRSPAELLALAKKQIPACVLLDVHLDGLNIAELVAGLKAIGNILVIGYGSHVAADVLKAARADGCDLVQPRSQFIAELQTNLPRWFAGREA